MLKWERPSNVTEIHSFMGLTGYYRRFIERFSIIVVSMTQLTKKEVKFKWSKKYEESL
jgi:hypothetical protein